MESRKETHQFKTEINQLMNIIIHSLYSHPEIFLRELISNASDAIDKLRFKSQLDTGLLGDDTEFKITLKPDEKNRTLEVSDNGIGMTYEEVVENIGTIAKSGTAGFLEAVNAAKKDGALAPELIGQFGVGFYSSFIVAEKVTLITRAAESGKATKWESSGDGSYTIEEVEKQARGTSVILKLKKVEEDEQDFTKEWVLRNVVKKHSDFVAYPVVMDVKKTRPVLDKDGKPEKDKTETVVEEETLNSMKAIWSKDKSEVSEEEYNEFYNHISHDWNPPLSRLHLKLEGTTEYSALLYIPSKAPFNFFSPEHKHGIQLYSRRVFIMENCADLMPIYLGFVKGVVDAPDLNLNVSREILQHNTLVKNIRKNLVRKLL
ncbi:MAG TPA: molecular chaperone HtpG, partial [Smithellaceae bacterium]|nr:molecular chaperone HtpG [Smithellaceae bacterium]